LCFLWFFFSSCSFSLFSSLSRDLISENNGEMHN
jgi:hypothetical protein